MAIDIMVHTSFPLAELELKLSQINVYFSEVYENAFIIYKGKNTNEINKEIAAEYNFNSETLFVFSLNEKSQANKIGEAVNYIKEKIGNEKVLILFENETRM